MPSKNKARGNAAERAFVDMAKEHGLEATRAWGSDGRAMGEHEEVDVRVNLPASKYSVLMQIKRRKVVADYILPGDFVHAQGIYMDGRGSKKKRMLVVLEAESYFSLLSASARLEEELGI